MLDIIQGERQVWKITIFKLDAAGNKSFLNLTGNVEITVCFKSGANLLTLTRVAGSRVTVDSLLEGKISGFMTIAETEAMPVITDGSFEVAVDFGAGDVQKSIVIDSHKVTEKICA